MKPSISPRKADTQLAEGVVVAEAILRARSISCWSPSRWRSQCFNPPTGYRFCGPVGPASAPTIAQPGLPWAQVESSPNSVTRVGQDCVGVVGARRR